jgi:hypothetical protein
MSKFKQKQRNIPASFPEANFSGEFSAAAASI